jgi:hypothetical protein
MNLHKKISLPRYTIRDLYADLLNVEYLLGLVGAFLLGARQIPGGITCLVLTLGLGRYNCKLYFKIMDGIK